MTGTGTLFSLGAQSKTCLLAYEEDKISIELTAAADLKQGQPVKLNTTGGVVAWAKTDLQHLLVGYAAFDVLNGNLVTIITRGFAVIFAISAAAVVSGIGTYNGYDSTNADTNQYGQIGYNIWIAGTDVTDTVGWILDPAAAANALVRVLLKD